MFTRKLDVPYPPGNLSCPDGEIVHPPITVNYDWNGVMLLWAIGCIVTVLVTTIVMYYIYFRFCYAGFRPRLRRSGTWRSGISRRRRFSWSSEGIYHFTASPTNEGLSSAAVEALPVFVFKAEDFKDGMRCAVCLCEFEENERGRILPNCEHSFHVQCIDMWFYSHSTCPLCRQGVESVVEGRDLSAEDKIVSVSGSGGSENDGVEERKETEGEKIEEAVAIVVAAREESHLV